MYMYISAELKACWHLDLYYAELITLSIYLFYHGLGMGHSEPNAISSNYSMEVLLVNEHTG